MPTDQNPDTEQLLQWPDQHPGSLPVESIPVQSLTTTGTPRLQGKDSQHVNTLLDVEDALPPIVVHRPTRWVIDGMHRLRAAIERGDRCIDARLFDGSAADAFVLAVRLNATHGLPLSPDDRRSAAAQIIKTHPHWSNRMVASATGLSHKSVAAVRHRADSANTRSTERVGKDGRTRPADGTAGRLRASQLLSDQPDASLREVAELAGIALGTARDVQTRLHHGNDPLPPKQRQAQTASAQPGTATSTGRTPGHGTAASGPESTPGLDDTKHLVHDLHQDPSLRYTDAGRVLLRLLEAHSSGLARSGWLVTTVPEHCARTVALAARGCAASWIQFARDLEQRTTTLERAS